MPHFLFSCLYWQTLQLVSWLSYCEKCGNKHWCASISVLCWNICTNIQVWVLHKVCCWFLRKLRFGLHSGWTPFSIPAVHNTAIFCPHPPQHLLLLVFLMSAPLSGWEEILSTVWVCFLWWLMMLSTFLYDYWPFSLTSSFENCLPISLGHLLIGLFGFLVFRSLSSFFILYSNHWSDV